MWAYNISLAAVVKAPGVGIAIGSVLAAQVYDVLKQERQTSSVDSNAAYAAELRKLTAESWHNAG